MNLRAAGPGWLFCPADRPERFAKAAAAADVVILDLEDGVAEARSLPRAMRCRTPRWTRNARWCVSMRAVLLIRPAIWRPSQAPPIPR